MSRGNGEERRGDREHRDLRSGELRPAHHVQREHRLPGACLDHDEGDEQCRRGGERRNDPGAAPTVLVAAQQPEDQQEEPADQRDLPGNVDAPRGRVLALADRAVGDPQDDGADRHVDEEDRPPAEDVRERAADERAECEGRADGGAVGGQRLDPVGRLRRGLRDQRERRGEHQRCAEALNRPRGDEHLDASGRTANGRAEGEDREAQHEELAPPDTVGDGAGGEDRCGERDRVRVDHPLQAVETRVEATGDPRQRRVDDADVQHQHRRRGTRRRWSGSASSVSRRHSGGHDSLLGSGLAALRGTGTASGGRLSAGLPTSRGRLPPTYRPARAGSAVRRGDGLLVRDHRGAEVGLAQRGDRELGRAGLEALETEVEVAAPEVGMQVPAMSAMEQIIVTIIPRSLVWRSLRTTPAFLARFSSVSIGPSSRFWTSVIIWASCRPNSTSRSPRSRVCTIEAGLEERDERGPRVVDVETSPRSRRRSRRSTAAMIADEQFVLVREVPVGRPDADPGVPGDVVETGLDAARGRTPRGRRR